MGVKLMIDVEDDVTQLVVIGLVSAKLVCLCLCLCTHFSLRFYCCFVGAGPQSVKFRREERPVQSNSCHFSVLLLYC
jgi:hypothetical protein